MNATTIESVPTVTLKPPTGLVNDKRKDGWKLLEDTAVKGNPELELAEFLESGESSVKGDVLFKRAKKLGNRAGQQHAERLLAQQDTIPEEWREFYLVFPGTKWRDSYGHLYVPYLAWRGGEWYLNWRWLGRQWSPSYRPVRCK